MPGVLETLDFAMRARAMARATQRPMPNLTFGVIFTEFYEAFEDALLVGLGDPDALVDDFEADGVMVGLEAYLDGALVAIDMALERRL